MSKADKLKKPLGKVWIHVPSMNLRQGSGVEFRGKYVTLSEYRAKIARKEVLKRSRLKDDESS